jgi:hypothetical protein
MNPLGAEEFLDVLWRMLRDLASEEPRLFVFLLLAERGILSKGTIMNEGGLSNDQLKRALGWLIGRGYVQRLILYENGRRIAGYHVRAAYSFLPIVQFRRTGAFSAPTRA